MQANFYVLQMDEFTKINYYYSYYYYYNTYLFILEKIPHTHELKIYVKQKLSVLLLVVF